MDPPVLVPEKRRTASQCMHLNWITVGLRVDGLVKELIIYASWRTVGRKFLRILAGVKIMVENYAQTSREFPVSAVIPACLGMSVSRRCGWLSLKRCARFPQGTGLILPVRGRARAEIRVRTFLAEGYAASIGRQRAVTEGPDLDEFGRNHDSAQVEVPSSSFGGSTAASRRRRSRHATRLSS